MQTRETATVVREIGRYESGNFFKLSILFVRDSGIEFALDALNENGRSFLDALNQGNKRFEVCYEVIAVQGKGNFAGKYFTNVNLLSYLCTNQVQNSGPSSFKASDINANSSVPNSSAAHKTIQNDNDNPEDDLPF